MNTTKKNARIAGLLYLAMALTGPLGIMYVPSSIMVAGDPAATAGNIISSEFLFRLATASSFLCQIFFVFLVLALGRLFKGVDKWHEKLMFSLVIVAVPIAFFNELTQLAALHFLSGADYLNVFTPEQLNSLVLALLNIHEQGIIVVSVFWGLWLFPFGYLAIKSGFIPRIFGILLIINCFAYLLDSFTAVLLPDYHNIVAKILLLPISAGEISMILWLLIKGAKEIPSNQVSETN